MDNIDVLLKAAEYIDAQENLGNDSKTPKNLNIESSLSPISSVSYSSSSSSSLINSPNNSINPNSASNHQICQRKLDVKINKNSLIDFNSNIYSSSLPSNFVCSPNLLKTRKEDEITFTFNKSMSRLEEMKRDKAIHNTLEKNRRAHLKGCFENLQNELPQYKDKKCTNLAILNYTLKFIELAKKKDKENEIEKRRLLEEQFNFKKKLSELAIDLKQQYLRINDNSVDDADLKFRTILKSLNIDHDLFISNANDYTNDNKKFDENSHSSSCITATSPKQIVAKYYRKRSSNSLSIITGIKTIQPTQSLQLQLQNQLKLQKLGKRLNSQHRHRHYSVDDNIISRQRNRKKTVSINQNDFESNFDEENDDLDEYNSADETNATHESEIDYNSCTEKDTEHMTNTVDDDESNDLIINEEDEFIKKLNKEETIDIETLSDKSNSPLNGYDLAKVFDKNNISIQEDKNKPQIIIKTLTQDSNEMKIEKAFNILKKQNLSNKNETKSNSGYSTKSLIPNVRNLNLKTSIQETTSENFSFNKPCFFLKKNQNSLNPKQ